MSTVQEEVDVTTDPTRRRSLQRAAGGLTAVLCAWLALPGAAAAPALPGTAQTVELTWKLEAGTDLVYRQSVESEAELPQGMGTSTTNMETTQRWNVLEVDGAGDATIRITTERVRMSLTGPMGTVNVDSADEASSGSPFDAMKTMAGTSFSIVLDPRGTLIEMSGLEEVREALRAGISDPSGHAMLDQVMSDEALRALWAQGGYTLPGEAVGVGSAWDGGFTVPIPLFGAMTAVTVHQVESIDGDLVVIGSSGTLSLADGAATSSPIPVKFGDMAMVATTRFDAGRGLLLGTEATMTLQTIMAMGGRETVLDSVTTVTVELVEGGD